MKSYSEFVNYLKELQFTLYIKKYDPNNPRSLGWIEGWTEEKVDALSKKEVFDILDTAKYYNMPMTIYGVGFSFGQIGIRIFENEQFPGIKPDCLFILSENHLKVEDFRWVKRPTLGAVHDEAWELFSQFTHSEDNLKRLDFSGIERPREKSYWNY